MPGENNNKPLWTDDEVQAIIDQARTWINVKFRHQGRSRYGVDCVGLFSCVGKEIGKPDPIPSNYTRNPNTAILKAGLEERLDEVKIKDMQPGDVLVLRFEDVHGDVKNQHVALRTDRGILHSAAMYRKVTEHCFDQEWADRVEHVYRFRRVQA